MRCWPSCTGPPTKAAPRRCTDRDRRRQQTAGGCPCRGRAGAAPRTRRAVRAATAQGADLEAWCRLWRRECLLMPLALYIDAHDVPAGESSDASAAVLGRLLDRLHALAFVATRDAHALGAGGRDGLLVTAIERPSATEQTQAWLDLLGESREALASRLASQFNFNLPQIASMVRSAGRAAGDDGDSGNDGVASALWTACRQCAHSKMDMLSQRIRPKAEWDDIVLPAETLRCCARSSTRSRQRSTVYDDWGFARADEPRPRRSARCSPARAAPARRMAAEVLADELRLDLYRIDLVGGGQQVHRRDREEPARACSTPPRTAARSCSSTRPTRCSASAARSRTATTATPTSRSATCCSAWRRIAAWRS